MHILEQYAINCGAKISKPFILKEFFPIPFEKYIVLHAGSGMDSKNYDYFDSVVQYIKPFLDSKNIHIVQVGGPQEKQIEDCYSALGTSKRQIAHIIDNSLLYFGNDTMSLHFASFFQKKIVCTSTVLYKSCFYPYWSNNEDYEIIESHRDGKKPTFSAQEKPKTINLIKPEEVASPILKYLGFENFKLPKTTFIGDKYGHLLLESTPSTIVPPNILPNILLNIRFDYVKTIEEKDYVSIFNNLNIRDCAFITDKFIDLKKFYNLKHKIKNIFYDITSTEIDFNFLNELYSLNFKVDFVFNKSKESNEDILNSKKLQLIDHQEVINIIENTNQDFKNLVQSSLFYKSKKLLFANNSIYLSKAGYLENKPIIVNNLNISQKISEISNIDNLKEDLDYILLYK
jgi:hypothetical protein